MRIKLIKINTFSDKRGKLSIFQNNDYLDFKIKRFYYIYDLKKNISRGSHAHKKTTQIAICLKGQCEYLLDNGKQKKNIILSSNKEGLILEKGIWHELKNCSSDCIVLIIADKLYDRSDYIEDYEKFLKYTKKF